MAKNSTLYPLLKKLALLCLLTISNAPLHLAHGGSNIHSQNSAVAEKNHTPLIFNERDLFFHHKEVIYLFMEMGSYICTHPQHNRPELASILENYIQHCPSNSNAQAMPATNIESACTIEHHQITENISLATPRPSWHPFPYLCTPKPWLNLQGLPPAIAHRMLFSLDRDHSCWRIYPVPTHKINYYDYQQLSPEMQLFYALWISMRQAGIFQLTITLHRHDIVTNIATVKTTKFPTITTMVDLSLLTGEEAPLEIALFSLLDKPNITNLIGILQYLTAVQLPSVDELSFIPSTKQFTSSIYSKHPFKNPLLSMGLNYADFKFSYNTGSIVFIRSQDSRHKKTEFIAYQPYNRQPPNIEKLRSTPGFVIIPPATTQYLLHQLMNTYEPRASVADSFSSNQSLTKKVDTTSQTTSQKTAVKETQTNIEEPEISRSLQSITVKHAQDMKAQSTAFMKKEEEYKQKVSTLTQERTELAQRNKDLQQLQLSYSVLETSLLYTSQLLSNQQQQNSTLTETKAALEEKTVECEKVSQDLEELQKKASIDCQTTREHKKKSLPLCHQASKKNEQDQLKQVEPGKSIEVNIKLYKKRISDLKNQLECENKKTVDIEKHADIQQHYIGELESTKTRLENKIAELEAITKKTQKDAFTGTTDLNTALPCACTKGRALTSHDMASESTSAPLVQPDLKTEPDVYEKKLRTRKRNMTTVPHTTEQKKTSHPDKKPAAKRRKLASRHITDCNGKQKKGRITNGHQFSKIDKLIKKAKTKKNSVRFSDNVSIIPPQINQTD